MDAGVALASLAARGDAGRAAAMAAYHRTARRCLGVPNPVLNDLVAGWRAALDVPGRVALAAGLWDSDVHEARIAAAKLLTQARIRPDAAVWAEILRWVPTFDGWAIADHACDAGARRLTADPARLEVVEDWTRDPSTWVRRAALVITLPWAKLPFPGPEDRARRERILGWAARCVADRDRFIQKAVASWLRTLARREPARVRGFLDGPGAGLRGFARREALRGLASGGSGPGEEGDEAADGQGRM